jgi:hypothetical protein
MYYQEISLLGTTGDSGRLSARRFPTGPAHQLDLMAHVRYNNILILPTQLTTRQEDIHSVLARIGQMDVHPNYSLHFHIKWKRKETLDWECFVTYSDATARARELAGPGEMFTIEEVSADCPSRREKSP